MPLRLNLYKNKLGFTEVNVFIKNENELLAQKHNHTFYDLLLVKQGSLIHSIDDKDIVLHENDVCFVHPDTVHILKKNKNERLILVNFEVSFDFVERMTKELGLDSFSDGIKYNDVFLHCSNHEMHNIMQLLTKAHNTDRLEYSQSCLKNIIVKLLSKLADNCFFPKENINDNSIVSSFLNELSDQKNFNLSIESICRKKSYTHEHVSRLFKQANLASPNKIFLKNKLAFSCTLLKTSSLSIVKIAELCGIYTISHFNKAFKKEYNVTPSQYRKNNRAYDRFTSPENKKGVISII